MITRKANENFNVLILPAAMMQTDTRSWFHCRLNQGTPLESRFKTINGLLRRLSGERSVFARSNPSDGGGCEPVSWSVLCCFFWVACVSPVFRLCFTGACPVALVGCTRAVCALSVFEEDGLGKEHPTVGDGLFLASPGPD